MKAQADARQAEHGDAWAELQAELAPFHPDADPAAGAATQKAARDRADASRQQQAELMLVDAHAELARVADYVRVSTVAAVAAAAGDDAAAGWADDLKTAAVAAAVPVWRVRMEGGLDILDGKFTGVGRRADAVTVRATPALWLALRRADADRLLAELGSAVRLGGPAVAADAPTFAPAATSVHRMAGDKPHPLAACIEEAQRRVDDPNRKWSNGYVWAQLLGMAQEVAHARGSKPPPDKLPHAPILDAVGDDRPAIRFEQGTGEPGLWTRKANGDYLRNRRPK